MGRSKIESTARMVANGLRVVASYPAPDDVTLDRVNVVIRSLEEDHGLAASTMTINLAVDLLVAHWNRLLHAPSNLFTMSRETYPLLETQIQRLAHVRDLYLEQRNRLDTF